MTEEERGALLPCPLQLDAPALRRMRIREIDGLAAGATYETGGLLRVLIGRFKYKRAMRLAGPLCELVVAGALLLELPPDAVFCPVPLHWRRRFERGFNQAEVLARAAGEARGRPVRPLLRRVRSTGQQAGRGRGERLQAMNGAFAVIGNAVPRHVVLVDDVVTTGSTLAACADVLKHAGAQRVDAVTVAVRM